MCGICGFNWADSTLLKKMNDSQMHRGPDAEGAFIDGKVSLGHRRLAIIDLSEKGKQPMSNREGTVTVVFNGEIYNFQELRSELEEKGRRFETESDTEVIIQSYLEWGPECVRKFNGMWAFCLYDREKRQFFLSRDRIGKKPLYYYFDGDRFIFSSELKAILEHDIPKDIDRTALELYLSLGFIPAPHSIFRDIKKLERSQNLVFDIEQKKMKTYSFWDLGRHAPGKNKKELIREGREILDNSVLLRKIADVPVGTFLSGGLDSSAVTATLKKFKQDLHTFSIGFEESDKYRLKYDESKYANLVSEYLGTTHHHFYFLQKNFEEMVEAITFAYDEPFWDFSAYPTAKVSELARKEVTVVLSGDGGDEVFGGYYAHKAAARIELARKFPKAFLKAGHRFSELAYNISKKDRFLLGKEGFKLALSDDREFYSNLLSGEKYLSEQAKIWYRKNLSKVLENNSGLTEGLIKFDLLYRTLPDNFLVKVDRASMLHALEVRCPFLDYRFLEYGNRIPTSMKVDFRKTKKLMREIIKDRVPKKIVNRGKQGFMPPILDWLYNEYWGLVEEKAKVLRESKILSEAQSQQLAKSLLIRPKTHRETTIYGERLYQFFALGNWAERWLL
ncbi:MAG: asparagine synthase (glutamine-hydrolyzing) [Candidatus Aenigmarchaeota archaeon]|nr:asparagine synthase (glutamine-hydrolyzing) [Candidatus Aenigmarchaeota archaeon]